MKRKLFLLALVVLGTFVLTAQERDQDRIQDQDRTKLVMVNGEMLELRDRAEMRLKEKQTLSDGSVILPDGTYQTVDGAHLKLQNGECLDGDGIKYRNEYQYRYKVNQENTGLTGAQIQERNQNRVQYSMIDGEMYLVRNQEQQRIQERLDLGNGIVVNADGSYQIRDQKKLQLHDGECLNTEGQKFNNMYQYRKMMIQKNMAPNKKMIKKGVNKPPMQKKKKSTK
jgi:hypothetical protein